VLGRRARPRHTCHSAPLGCALDIEAIALPTRRSAPGAADDRGTGVPLGIATAGELADVTIRTERLGGTFGAVRADDTPGVRPGDARRRRAGRSRPTR
jgi:hypothetical protein